MRCKEAKNRPIHFSSSLLPPAAVKTPISVPQLKKKIHLCTYDRWGSIYLLRNNSCLTSRLRIRKPMQRKTKTAGISVCASVCAKLPHPVRSACLPGSWQHDTIPARLCSSDGACMLCGRQKRAINYIKITAIITTSLCHFYLRPLTQRDPDEKVTAEILPGVVVCSVFFEPPLSVHK